MSKQFESEIVELQGYVLNFAYQLTSNKDEAFDIVQDTMLKALDNEAKFTEGTNLKGWLFTIARNIFINNYRKKVRSNTIFDTTDNLFMLNLCQDSRCDTPEGTISIKEISAVISKMDNAYKVPFNMFVAGYKYTEIAEAMKLPLGTIKSRVFHARKQLQEELKDYKHYGS